MILGRYIAACAVLAVLAPPAAGAGGTDFLRHLMGRDPGQGKTFACFTRVYDDGYLAAHLRQNMRAMDVLVVAYSSLSYAYQLRMGFRFKDRPELLTSVAECGTRVSKGGSPQGSARCAGPIGAIHRMSLSLEGDHSLLMMLPDGARLWRPGPPQPTNTVDDAFGPDDRLFRLDRTALSHCDDQAIGDDEKALLDRGR